MRAVFKVFKGRQESVSGKFIKCFLSAYYVPRLCYRMLGKHKNFCSNRTYILRITLEIDSSCGDLGKHLMSWIWIGLWHLRWGNDIPGARNEQKEQGRVHGVLGFTVVGARGGKFLVKDHGSSNREGESESWFALERSPSLFMVSHCSY